MAEENQTGATQQNGEAPQQQFIIERVYVKDISFEAPNSPEVFFQEDWEPDTSLNLNTQVNEIGDGRYEVELHLNLTVKNKNNEKTAFLVELVQAGLFIITGLEADHLNYQLASYCPSCLFPYARETVAGLVSKGSFPEMHLSPINFDALYAQNMAQRQAEMEAGQTQEQDA